MYPPISSPLSAQDPSLRQGLVEVSHNLTGQLSEMVTSRGAISVLGF